MPLWHRVDPDEMRVDVGHAFQPSSTWLFVPMLHAATGISDLVWAHGRIANEDDFVVSGKFVQHVPSRQLLCRPATIVFPHFLIDAIMEVKIFHMLELGAGGGE